MTDFSIRSLYRPELRQASSISSTSDTGKSTIEGVIIMLISGSLYATLAALVKWSHQLGYSSAMVLFYRSLFQIVVAFMTAAININIKPKCICPISCNIKSMIDTVKYMNTKKKSENSNIDNDAMLSCQNETNDTEKPKKATITTSKLWLAILCRGLFGAIATFTYFESTDLIPIGSGTTLISLSCINASFFGWMFLGDKITRNHCLALILGVIGSILISQPSFIFVGDSKNNASTENNELGYILALISAVMIGFVYLTIRIAKQSPLWLLIVSQGLCCIIFASFLIFVIDFKGTGFHGVNYKNINEIICIGGIGIVGFVASWTLTKGAQKLIAGISSLLRSSTNMTVSFILEIMLFRTYPDWITIAGAIFAFSAVVIISLEKINAILDETSITKYSVSKKNNM